MAESKSESTEAVNARSTGGEEFRAAMKEGKKETKSNGKSIAASKDSRDGRGRKAEIRNSVIFLPTDDCNERFRKVSEKLLGENIWEITEELADKAVKGSENSFKLLLMLAYPNRPGKKSAKRPLGPTQAMQLTDEVRSQNGAKAETAMVLVGSR